MTDQELIDNGYRFLRGRLAGLAITQNGELWSLKTDAPYKTYDGPHGTIQSTFNGKNIYPHRIVAELWLDKPSDVPDKSLIVAFKDGDKSHIHPDNLYWTTKRSYRGGDCKPIDEGLVRELKRFLTNSPKHEASKIFHISYHVIDGIMSGKGHYSRYAHINGSAYDTGSHVMVVKKSLKLYGDIGIVTGFTRQGVSVNFPHVEKNGTFSEDALMKVQLKKEKSND